MKSPGFLSIDPHLSLLENFQKGQIVLIDKPLNWTSFQVVNKIRFLIKHRLQIKKIKVGHAGTLDPLATGLLILCVGKETKQIHHYQARQKTYTGTLVLGATRPSFDRETEIDKTYATDHLTEEMIHKATASFVGKQHQMPPIFSAKKVDGERAYKKARKGRSVVLAPQEVMIHFFDITRISGHEVDFITQVSKGTYIRSLANDFGKYLESGAYLSSLRRTEIGEFSVTNALSIEAFETWLKTMD